MKHRLLLATAVCLGVASSNFAQSATELEFAQCPEHFPSITVDGAPTIRVPSVTPVFEHLKALCFSEFAVLHSGQTKTPLYVVERLSRDKLQAAKSQKRKDKFYEEARLPSSHRARLADYRSSLRVQGVEYRFDRGHMAPAGNMATAQGMAQSFSLANMVPQIAQANRGPWAKTEADTRKYATRAKGNVYTFTGPFFAANAPRLGPSGVWVPAATFKLVYDEEQNRAWAYWLENADTAKITRPISYEELVKRTGIEFLP